MSPTWEQYKPHSKVRMVLMQNLQDLTTISGSHMEEQPTAEGERCDYVINKALHTEN